MESTTRKPRNRRKLDENDTVIRIKRRSIFFGSLLAVFVAPVTFKASKYLEVDALKADILASLLTILLAIIFSILVSTLNRKQNDLNLRSKGHNVTDLNDSSTFWSFFAGASSYIYGQSPTSSPRRRKQNLDSGYRSLGGANESEQKRSKIDPKYFKPKFIMGELMTFWDTTCTVITWGSFYVIGGTIVATEKLAQKIKTKREKTNNNLRDSAHSTSSSRFEAFTSSFSSSPSASSGSRADIRQDRSSTQPRTSNRTPNKLSTWTKQSFASVKKKLTKISRGTSGIGQMPKIEQSRNLLYSGLSSTSFRSS